MAPILIELTRFLRCQLRIEYPLSVDNWLKGELDYLLRTEQALVVIEAKRDDLTRGFTQLAVELIALAQVEELEVIYGAVTIGNVWVFGQLNRLQKRITQGLQLYTVPDDINALLSVLIGILEG